MFLSMTGFGNARETLLIDKKKKIGFSVEVKSLNSRFFEAVCKLPGPLSSLEIKIIELLKGKLVRGRIYLTLRASEDSYLFQTVKPNLSLVGDYLSAARKIKKEFSLESDLCIAELLKLPDVFISEEKDISGAVEKDILALIEKAADLLTKSRAVEGNNLKKDLEMFFDVCFEKMIKIKQLFIQLMKSKKDAIKKLLSQQNNGDESSKLKLDELYSVVNKIDINEEITRFDSHLKVIKTVLKDKSSSKGKRLDFILQELVRELNTINAKSGSFDISSLAVDIKVELEKAREQVQNIV
ncbi:MAG: YicC/YloC family endoribonuclease [bacterium]